MAPPRSFSSSTLGSIPASATQRLLTLVLSNFPLTQRADGPLEDEAAGARRVRKCLHPSVIHVASPVEDDALEAARLGPLGEQRTHGLGGVHVAARPVLPPELLAPAVRGDQRARGVVVDELGVDVIEAAEHRQPRPRGRAAHAAADAHLADVAGRSPIAGDHFAPAPAFLPTLRRITSSAYLMPLPLYGSGLRSARSFAAVSPSSALSGPRRVIAT